MLTRDDINIKKDLLRKLTKVKSRNDCIVDIDMLSTLFYWNFLFRANYNYNKDSTIRVLKKEKVYIEKLRMGK